MTRGAVRLRSNVVLEPPDRLALDRAWNLVPGEIVETWRPGHLQGPLSATRRQRDEKGLYLSCTLCGRLTHQIAREGCEAANCGAARPDSESVMANRARHHEALELIALEREHLSGAEHATEDDAAAPILSPEAAVERLLGIAATNDGLAPGAGPQLAPGLAPEEAIEPLEGLRALPAAPKGETPAPSAADGAPGVSGESSLPPFPSAVQAAARAALAAAAAETGRFTDGYCSDPVANLVDSLTLGQARRALDDLSRGDGAELVAHGAARPKFCAAHSSAALAVNTFAAWIGNEAWLQLADRAGFTRLEFEAKFPTGLGGRAPNLDVYLSGPSAHVAIESKCTEQFAQHPASFQESYDALVDEIAHPSWRSVFEQLRGHPSTFALLNAGQLMRHYLGLRRAILDGRAASIALIYLYWEPSDSAAAADHATETAQLVSSVDDPTVPLSAISYRDLWQRWTTHGAPPWLLDHVTALRKRYDVALNAP
jgi:hypothetical protein